MEELVIENVKEILIKCKGNHYLPYSKLKTFQGNLKEMSKESAEKLRQSIIKHGWIAPIFIWNKNYILDGHGRLLVLEKLLQEGYKIKDLPIVDINAKTKKEAAEILLAINSKYQIITDDGLYEFMNEMDLKFEDLKDFELPDIDMEKFGAGYFGKEGLTDDDAVPDAPEKAQTKIGDIYILGGRHRVMCGDSTKKEDIEKLMDGKKADMVFTDPPYAVNYGADQETLNKQSGNKFRLIARPIIGDNLTTQKCAERIWKPTFNNLYQFAKDDCSFYMTMCQGGDQMMMMMMMMMNVSWQIKHELIWVKNSPVFSMGRLDYDCQHEPILFGWKKKHNWYGKGQFLKSIWEIPKPHKSDLHPTMKPIALIVNALQNSTRQNEICLDSFLGSGSTLIACEKINRICYGMELDTHYCDVIVQRWVDYTGKNEIIKNRKAVKWSSSLKSLKKY